MFWFLCFVLVGVFVAVAVLSSFLFLELLLLLVVARCFVILIICSNQPQNRAHPHCHALYYIVHQGIIRRVLSTARHLVALTIDVEIQIGSHVIGNDKGE